jgi:IS30 family transposase
MEKVAIDILQVEKEKQLILIYIDYFTRWCRMKLIENKMAMIVLNDIEEFCKSFGKPEEILTDNGREFANDLLKKFLANNKIKHKLVSVEPHRSNGRV